MFRFFQYFPVATLLLNGVFAEFNPRLFLSDGITFFQGFNGYSCYWNDYAKNLEWARINNEADPQKCARLCFTDERCTGFELSIVDTDPYCAFWYGGTCGHEEMRMTYSTYFLGSQEPQVSTYVLMDGHARFYKKQCDYEALNIEPGVNMFEVSNVNDSSESKCTNLCDHQENCTGSVAPVTNIRGHSSSRCNVFSDHSCTIPREHSKSHVTTIRHPERAPFTDAYSMCNPYSEVLRGYNTCENYTSTFPCDCDRALDEICTDGNTSATRGKGFAWKHKEASTCVGRALDMRITGSISSCKAACEAHSDCGCFDVTTTGCVLHASSHVVTKDGHLFHDAYSLTRVVYDPQATLSAICPSTCEKAKAAHHARGSVCNVGPRWYGPSFMFLLVLTPIMFCAVVVMAIWTYVRRRCFPHPDVPAPIPAMNKKEINAMGTEKFTSESELKYGQIECSICIASFEVGDEMRVMKCGHRFHKDCVDEWLTRYKAVCPLCKVDMRAKADQCEECESEAEGDIELGDVAGENESNPAQTPESVHEDHNPDNALQRRVVIDETDASALSEPLLENENEHTSFLASDGLANADAEMDMLPLMEENQDEVVDEEGHDQRNAPPLPRPTQRTTEDDSADETGDSTPCN